MLGPTDLFHPSPAPHFKTFQVFLIIINISIKNHTSYIFEISLTKNLLVVIIALTSLHCCEERFWWTRLV